MDNRMEVYLGVARFAQDFRNLSLRAEVPGRPLRYARQDLFARLCIFGHIFRNVDVPEQSGLSGTTYNSRFDFLKVPTTYSFSRLKTFTIWPTVLLCFFAAFPWDECRCGEAHDHKVAMHGGSQVFPGNVNVLFIFVLSLHGNHEAESPRIAVEGTHPQVYLLRIGVLLLLDHYNVAGKLHAVEEVAEWLVFCIADFKVFRQFSGRHGAVFLLRINWMMAVVSVIIIVPPNSIVLQKFNQIIFQSRDILFRCIPYTGDIDRNIGLCFFLLGLSYTDVLNFL